MENHFLIVGLGNPGSEYAFTRHNAGFLAVDLLATRWHGAWKTEKRFQARVARVTAERGNRVLLVQPQTFMNASGESVRALVSFYRIQLPRLLVLVDDADLALGCLRMRPDGSSGGHHGLESIERCLGTREFVRLRIGIGRRDSAREITSHVLGRFESTEAALMNKVLLSASDQAACWVEFGVQKAMNQFNGIVVDPESEGKEK